METMVQKKEPFMKKYGLLIAFLVLAAIFAFPTPAELPTAGHRMLGILVFAVMAAITGTMDFQAVGGM